MIPTVATPTRTFRTAIVLTLGVAALTTAVAWFGMRGEPAATPTPEPTRRQIEDVRVRSIVLPHDEPDFPAGPNRESFVVSCTPCHSTRLVATQPLLPRAKWAESVHKMVAVYGAPITPQREAEIVEYLTTIQSE